MMSFKNYRGHCQNFKPFLVLVTLQLLMINVYCQADSISKAFIWEVLKKEPGSKSMIYLDRLGKYYSDEFRSKLQASKIKGYEPVTQKYVELTLTSKERKLVLTSLKLATEQRWRDSIFNNSRMIPADSLWPQISKCLRSISDSTRETGDYSGVSGLRASRCNVFQFSNPIFLRNRTLVIFYFLRLCGGECGIADMGLYRLEEGKYKKWLILGSGAF